MLLALLAIVTGLVILVWSADKFVIGAAATARHFGMSPLLVGMTIVAMGTSAPEMFVSTMAAIDGAGNLAIGNAVGSNIVNIGLVLGFTAMLAPLPIQGKMLRKEIPILLLVTVIAGLVIQDLILSFWDAIIMFSCMVVTLYWLFREEAEAGIEVMDAEEADEIEHTSGKMAAFWLISGLALLMLSSKMLVWGAVEVATFFGVNELIIGLTIVAVGTSLPEFAATLASARKGHHDIAIGNVVGSNIFNLLAVMPIPGLLGNLAIQPAALYRDYSMMLAITLVLVVFIYAFRQSGKVGRGAGFALFGGYLAYTAYLISQAQV